MDIFTTLADPTRRTIIEMLAKNGPLSATEISAHFPVSPPAISQHLKALREAQVVLMEKRAQQRIYQINPDAILELEQWAKTIKELWHQRFDTLAHILLTEQNDIENNTIERDNQMPSNPTLKKEVTITHLFDAPRSLVFKHWTDATQLAKWWGPNHFTVPFCTLDVRPGGAIRIDMRGPDGILYPGSGTFHEVIEPELLVFTTKTFNDAQGNPQLEILTTVTFFEHQNQTQLTLHITILKSTPAIDPSILLMQEGWTQSLTRLAHHLTQP